MTRCSLTSGILHACKLADDVFLSAGEGAQAAAWEADFLKDLYKVRQLKAKITQAVQQVRVAATMLSTPTQ